MMKLYTEEQVRKALQIGMNIGYSNNFDLNKLVEETDKGMIHITSIEIPNNEEIKEAAKDYHLKNGVYYAQEKTFINAIKWVIDKIKNQQ